jgi:hypothetical protein
MRIETIDVYRRVLYHNMQQVIIEKTRKKKKRKRKAGSLWREPPLQTPRTTTTITDMRIRLTALGN